jgi:hypothetical protein
MFPCVFFALASWFWFNFAGKIAVWAQGGKIIDCAAKIVSGPEASHENDQAADYLTNDGPMAPDSLPF